MKKNKFPSWFSKPTTLKITIKEVPSSVWWSLLFSILGVLNYETGFITISSSSRFMSAANSIINQLLITYITGLFLYFLIESLYKTKKKIAVHTSVSNNVLLIQERVFYLLNEIGKTTKKEKTDCFDLDRDEIREACEAINVDTQLVGVWFYPTLSFRDFVNRSCDEIKTACNEILLFSEVFSDKWASSLSKIIGLSWKITKSFDIRFASPKIEFYHLWAMYGELKRLEELHKIYTKNYFKISLITKGLFFPPDLRFNVDPKR